MNGFDLSSFIFFAIALSLLMLGNAASGAMKARKEGKFMSINDLKIRAKIGDKAIEVLRTTGCLEGMSQSNQLSIFDGL